MAFDRIYGLPDTTQRGILAALTVLCNLWSSKHKFKPEDFLGTRAAPPRVQPAAEGKARLNLLIALRKARGT